MEQTKKITDFKKVIKALLDNNQPFSPKYLHSFSDITPADLHSLKKIWDQVDPERRLALVKDLEPLLEADTLLSFDDFGQFAIKDSNPLIRSQAIRLLWESEDPHLVPVLTYLVQHDSSEEVRAAAAGALGKFIYLGEVEEIPANLLREVDELLLNIVQTSKQPTVQRQALEALGYSSRKEVVPLIHKAFKEKDIKWQSSALYAMGRSADRQWENPVLQMVDHHDEEVRLEAIRAAGELELVSAGKPLLEIVCDNSEDVDIRMTAIWSLSKIGGEEVRETLVDLLEKTEDEDEADIIEEALDNLSFTDDFHSFGLII